MYAFFNEIYALSKGNIGVALNMWIHHIDKGPDGQLILNKPRATHFPVITDPNWKIVLYHLVIHGRWSISQIELIFAKADWVLATLKELEKTGLVQKQSNTTYVLNHAAKPYIESWLSTLKILN